MLFFPGKRSANSQSRSSRLPACSRPHTRHLTFQNSGKGLPVAERSDLCLSTLLSVTPVPGGLGLFRPQAASASPAPPPLRPCWDRVADTGPAVENDRGPRSFGNIWHVPGKEKPNSSQGENWELEGNLWVLQKSTPWPFSPPFYYH